MLDVLKGLSMSQKIEIGKEIYYELKPKPTSSDTIAVYPYLVKLKTANNKYYAYAFSYWLNVKRRCIGLENSQCQIVLEYYNGHDKSEQMFPCSILTSKVITELLNYGALFEERYASSLIKYLITSMQNAPTEYLYQRLGWEQKEEHLIFKYNKVITNDNQKEDFHNYIYNGDLCLEPKGSLKVWLDMVKTEVIGNIPLTFVLALGFTSPILALLNEKYDLGCIVFNLSNFSSRGKSTAAMLATSVFSNPKINEGTLKSFYATENALTEFVSNCSGITVALDEVAMSSSKNFERFLYALCAGNSKGRLNGDSMPKELKKFSSVIITTAEFDILDENSPDGLKARVFELTDDLTTSSQNSDNVKTTILENYAVAGQHFIEKLIEYGKDNLFKLYDTAVEQLKKVKIKSPLKDRVISKIAVIWLTVTLMKKFFKLDIDEKKMTDYIVKLLKRFTLETTPESRLLDIVIEDTVTNRSKYEHNGSQSFGGSIGEVINRGKCKEIIMYKNNFEELMRKHHIINYKKILKILKSKGQLRCESDRLTWRTRDRIVCYCFIINNTDNSE